MKTAEQLWILKQVYSYENGYYDREKDLHLHRIPAKIPADAFRSLEESGFMPNQMFVPDHDEILQELYRLAAAWTVAEAADAFIAGLWSAPFLWESALTGKLLAMGMPSHKHTPYGGSADTCTVCGYRQRAVDITEQWYQSMIGGTPLDGEPVGHVLALREMERMGTRPVPTEFDIWTFRAVLTVIRQMPPGSRYSKVREKLYRERLLPTAKQWVYGSLLESLALIGILDTEDYPGLATQFTTYQKRDERPSVRVEVQAPLAWWDSSVGIHEAALEKVFAGTDCSSVNLAERPEPMPPLAGTVTGALEKIRAPRQKRPKSPAAGTGPVQAGDVYAIRVRDDAWVTVYCHRIEGAYALVEYLDGIFTEMPMKPQLGSTVRPRGNGRWQAKVSGIDRTTGVKRVARAIPAPVTELAEPDRISFQKAGNLGVLAKWCFEEL